MGMGEVEFEGVSEGEVEGEGVTEGEGKSVCEGVVRLRV